MYIIKQQLISIQNEQGNFNSFKLLNIFFFDSDKILENRPISFTLSFFIHLKLIRLLKTFFFYKNIVVIYITPT